MIDSSNGRPYLISMTYYLFFQQIVILDTKPTAVKMTWTAHGSIRHVTRGWRQSFANTISPLLGITERATQRPHVIPSAILLGKIWCVAVRTWDCLRAISRDALNAWRAVNIWWIQSGLETKQTNSKCPRRNFSSENFQYTRHFSLDEPNWQFLLNYDLILPHFV